MDCFKNYLSMCNNSYNLAVLDNLVQVIFYGFTAKIILPLLGSFCKCLLFALVPVEK